MSIVPYNSNGSVLYHNPGEGVLVLYNSLENSIQLLNTSQLEIGQSRISPTRGFTNLTQPLETSRFNESSTYLGTERRRIECPNCGFRWSEYEKKGPQRGHRKSNDNGSTNIHPLFDRALDGSSVGVGGDAESKVRTSAQARTGVSSRHRTRSGRQVGEGVRLGAVLEPIPGADVGADVGPAAKTETGLNNALPTTFMHQDYFKLLALLPHSKGAFSSSPSPSSSTSTSSSSSSSPPQPQSPPASASASRYFSSAPRNNPLNEHSQEIPEGVFNQGYFNRFFKKVPPFVLGSGAHAQVYKVEHVLHNIVLGTYAIKRISVGDKYEYLEQVLNEVLILYELSSMGANENNLIRYNHVWLEMGELEDLSSFFLPSNGYKSKSSRVPYMYLLQQYCDGGHLEELIAKNFATEKFLSYSERVLLEREKRRMKKLGIEPITKKTWLSNFEIWKFFNDVTTGVSYLHKHGILHRDLKPSNCLMDVKYQSEITFPDQFDSVEEFEERVFDLPKVLVSDFGEGKFLDKHKSVGKQNKSKRQGNTGTLEYTAPELWLHSDAIGSDSERGYIYDFTFESDVYSLGLILCFLCIGELPFSEQVKNETDPENARDIISAWYKELTLSSFNEWFDSNVIAIRGSLDEVMMQFRDLCFEMIKCRYKDKDFTQNQNQNQSESQRQDQDQLDRRYEAKDVLLIMNDIKRNFFIISKASLPKGKTTAPISVPISTPTPAQTSTASTPISTTLTTSYKECGQKVSNPNQLSGNASSTIQLFEEKYRLDHSSSTILNEVEDGEGEEDDNESIGSDILDGHLNLTEEEDYPINKTDDNFDRGRDHDHDHDHDYYLYRDQYLISNGKKQAHGIIGIKTLPIYCFELLVLEFLSVYRPRLSQVILRAAIYAAIGIDLAMEELRFVKTTFFISITVCLSILLGYAIGDKINEMSI